MKNPLLTYTMGQLFAARDNSTSVTQLEELVDQALASGALVECNGRGNGFSVTGPEGTLMPREGIRLVFSNKGLAWVYWLGLGRPRGSALVCISDPEVEAETILARPVLLPTQKGDFEFEEVREPPGAPHLHLVSCIPELDPDSEPEPEAQERALVDLRELLEQIEEEYGVAMVAYAPDEDMVIYGEETLARLREG